MQTTTLTAQEIQSVKAQGFLLNKGTNEFSARIITRNGALSADQMQIVSQAAEKYGNGVIVLTVRLTLELQGISFDQIPSLIAFLDSHSLATGGTGAKVRPVVACKGTTCTNGLCDTLAAGEEIHARFYVGYRQVSLPHKFKIAIGGCPNNCVKPDLNDAGIVAITPPVLVADKCRGCAKCAVIDACDLQALSLQNGKIVLDPALCNHCGSCIGQCPFSAVESCGTRYRVYIGGRWGKKIRHGTQLTGAYTYQEALDMVEKSILLFKKFGSPKERFGETIDRLGVETVQSLLDSNQLLEEKESILNIQTKAEIKC